MSFDIFAVCTTHWGQMEFVDSSGCPQALLPINLTDKFAIVEIFYQHVIAWGLESVFLS